MKIFKVIFFLLLSHLSSPYVYAQGLTRMEVSTEGDDVYPILSPDRLLLFTTIGSYENNIGGIFGGQDIYVSKKLSNNNWSRPINLGTRVNTISNNSLAAVFKTSNGYKAILNNIYRGEKTYPGLSLIELDSEGMPKNNPKDISIEGLPKNPKTIQAIASASGEFLVLSIAIDTMSGPDIYISKRIKDFNWGPAEKLSTLNSNFKDIASWINNTGDLIYLFSNREEPNARMNGGFNIFQSNKIDGVWQTPTPLINTVNSSGFDGYLWNNTTDSVYIIASDGGNATSLNDIYLFSYKKPIAKPNPIVVKNDTQKISFNPVIEPKKSIVYFDFNASKLSEIEKRKILNLLDSVNNIGNFEIHLFGHTDSVGSDAYNYSLSESRAKAVGKLLNELGVPYNNLKIESMGRSKPVVSPKTLSGIADKSRRVEVEVKARSQSFLGVPLEFVNLFLISMAIGLFSIDTYAGICLLKERRSMNNKAVYSYTTSTNQVGTILNNHFINNLLNRWIIPFGSEDFLNRSTEIAYFGSLVSHTVKGHNKCKLIDEINATEKLLALEKLRYGSKLNYEVIKPLHPYSEINNLQIGTLISESIDKYLIKGNTEHLMLKLTPIEGNYTIQILNNGVLTTNHIISPIV